MNLQDFKLHYEEPPVDNSPLKRVKSSLTLRKRGGKIRESKRKDQTMKTKKQTNWVKPFAGAVILIGLSYGITEFLGGSLKDAIAGGFMAGTLAALYLLKDEK